MVIVFSPSQTKRSSMVSINAPIQDSPPSMLTKSQYEHIKLIEYHL